MLQLAAQLMSKSRPKTSGCIWSGDVRAVMAALSPSCPSSSSPSVLPFVSLLPVASDWGEDYVTSCLVPKWLTHFLCARNPFFTSSWIHTWMLYLFIILDHFNLLARLVLRKTVELFNQTKHFYKLEVIWTVTGSDRPQRSVFEKSKVTLCE